MKDRKIKQVTRKLIIDLNQTFISTIVSFEESEETSEGEYVI